MIDRTIERINTVNTTSFRILVSVGIAALSIVLVLIGVLFRNWLPSEQQITVLKGVGLFLGLMLGIDVSQFIGKRFSDASYAAAKNPTAPSPVTVEAPSTVTVEPAASPAPRIRRGHAKIQ